MTLDEVFKRVVQAHLRLIALCILIPVLAVGYLESHTTRNFVATVRTQVETQAPSSATEADALSSRVLALATTPYLVRQALKAAKLPGDPTAIADHHITSQRLGESPIVEISVSNTNGALAGEQVAAIATRVVQFMNDGNQQVFQQQLSAVKNQLKDAIVSRNQAARRVASQVTPTAVSQAQLSDAQSAVDRFNSTVSQMELSNATRDLVVLINGPDPQIERTSSSLVPRSALALLVGLLLGIAMATLLEALRPRVAGARSVARVLGAPVIGTTRQSLIALHHALSRAARRQGVETIALIGVDPTDEKQTQELLSELSQLDADSTQRIVDRVGGGAFDAGDAVVGALRGRIRFCALAEIGLDEEITAGLIVLTSGSPLQREVDEVGDLIETMRWPVVGILDSSSDCHWWERR